MIENDSVVYSKRLALQVERYHTWPKARGQSVGEHTAQVMRIYCALFGPPPAQVWLAILEHDMPEMRFGDLPFSGEYAPELKDAKAVVEARVRARMGLGLHVELTTDEKLRLKVCDLMDCFEWGWHESRMGNLFGMTVADNVVKVILDVARTAGCLQGVLNYMADVEKRP